MLTFALLRAKSGVAAVEFAITLPVLLTLGLGGLEVANFAITHLRISNIAMITADNAARVRESIDESDVNELFLGATLAGESIKFKNRGRVILYDLEPSPDGTVQWIRWQRCEGLKVVAPGYGRPKTAAGANITNGTEIFATNRTSVSSAPSSHAASTMTALGPATKQIAAQPGTAVMVAEVIYDYKPLVSNALLSGTQIRYLSAFNVRQRSDHSLRNSTRVTPKSCG
jgi:hypothetical protein